MKFLKRLAILLLVVLFFVSCEKKESEKGEEILKGYFSSAITVTSKNGKLSFEFEDEKIRFTQPDILKGTEVFYTGKGLTAKIHGQEISLPQTFASYITPIFSLSSKIKSGDTEDLKFQDNVLNWDNCELTVSENEIILKTSNKEFIVKRNVKNDGKNKGGGIS